MVAMEQWRMHVLGLASSPIDDFLDMDDVAAIFKYQIRKKLDQTFDPWNKFLEHADLHKSSKSLHCSDYDCDNYHPHLRFTIILKRAISDTMPCTQKLVHLPEIEVLIMHKLKLINRLPYRFQRRKAKRYKAVLDHRKICPIDLQGAGVSLIARVAERNGVQDFLIKVP